MFTTTKLIYDNKTFIALIYDKKEVYVNTNESNANRALIYGIIEVLKNLPNKSKIDVIVPVNFGFKYLKNNKKWTNRDLGNLLIDTINKKNLKIKYINYCKLNTYAECTKLSRTLKNKLTQLNKTTNTSSNKPSQIVNEENGIFNYIENREY